MARAASAVAEPTEDATVDNTVDSDPTSEDDMAALGIVRKDPPATTATNPAGVWDRRIKAVPKDGQWYLVMTAQTRKSASQSATAQRRKQKKNATAFVDNGHMEFKSTGEEIYVRFVA